jgi:hypothetical protein
MTTETPRGLTQSEIAEFWRTLPNPHPLADQIPNPEWEEIDRIDDITGKPVRLRRLHDAQLLDPGLDVYVGNVCGIGHVFSRFSDGHVHFQQGQWSICTHPRLVFNRTGKYNVHFLAQYAHYLVGWTTTETYGEVWEAACWHLGDRVGRHAVNHRSRLADGSLWSPEDKDYWTGASLGALLSPPPSMEQSS